MAAADDLDLQALTDAIAHWLAFKRRAGFQGLINEAAFVMPVAEFLFGHGWKVCAERDYNEQFQSVPKGHLYYDLIGKNQSHKFILETKFFKVSNHKRLLTDLLRLALPSESGWNRYLLVVWEDKKLYGDVQEILQLKQHEQASMDIEGNTLRINGRSVDRIPEWISNPPRNAKVTCEAKINRDAHNVAIFSVTRL